MGGESRQDHREVNMPKRGKAYKAALAEFDKQTYYETAEAFDILNKMPRAKNITITGTMSK